MLRRERQRKADAQMRTDGIECEGVTSDLDWSQMYNYDEQSPRRWCSAKCKGYSVHSRRRSPTNDVAGDLPLLILRFLAANNIFHETLRMSRLPGRCKVLLCANTLFYEHEFATGTPSRNRL